MAKKSKKKSADAKKSSAIEYEPIKKCESDTYSSLITSMRLGDSATSLRLEESASSLEWDNEQSSAPQGNDGGASPYKTKYITINPMDKSPAKVRRVQLPKLNSGDANWLFDPNSSKHKDMDLDVASVVSGHSSIRGGFSSTDESEPEPDLLLERLKKSRQQREVKAFVDMLNINPLDKQERKLLKNNEIFDIIEKKPEILKKKYVFEKAFPEQKIYPLSMMCALGATKKNIKRCYKAYPEALTKVDKWFGTPLHYACSSKMNQEFVECVLGLSDKETLLSTTDSQGLTPLHVAVIKHSAHAVISLLIDGYPAALRIADLEGNTPLHAACDYDAPARIVELLVNSDRVPCTMQSKNGATPIHLAIFQEMDFESVQFLVQAGPNALKLSDSKGRLPLHMAASADVDKRIVSLVAKKEPSALQKTDKNGRTPLALAKKKRREEKIIEILKG